MDTSSEDRQESFATRVFSVVFPVILFGLLGGGLCVWLAHSALWQAEREARGEWRRSDYEREGGVEPFRVFAWLKIRDWRTQFAIGAGMGVTLTVLWIRKSNREASKDKARDSDR